MVSAENITVTKEEAIKNFLIYAEKDNSWINNPEINIWNYGKIPNESDLIDKDDAKFYSLPFLDFCIEDKSQYPLLSETINERNKKYWIDPDNSFRVGKSGGILMNIDFIFVNTDVFTQVADYYNKYKKYCPYEKGTAKYKMFWKRETTRRRKGVQAKCKVYFKDIKEYFDPKTTKERKDELTHYIRITGDHYNYLNYGRIERTPNAEERKRLDLEGNIAVNTVPGFPRFWDADYWYFKADELVILNKKNQTIAKARRKGMSYKRGSQAANRVNLNKAVTVVLAADIIDYLTDPEATADMAKKNLTWYETETYWKRGFLSESIDSLELGYKKTKQGNKKFGFQSKILSVAIGRNESAAIGKKAIDIDFEESGKSPNLPKAWGVTLNNIESGAIKIGTGRIYGTAGTKGANWSAFRGIYYSPDANNMLPFENVWNRRQRHTKCCFFIPQIWCCEPYIYDGNSLLLSAWEWDKIDKKLQKSNLKASDYVTYCAQRANSPAEAFIDTKDNLFTSASLNEHIQDLIDDDVNKFYTDGWYVKAGKDVEFWNKQKCIKTDIFRNGGVFHEYIEDVPFTNNTDIHGCVREFYPPFKDKDGNVPPDLFFIVVDSFKVDKDAETVDVKNSLYSIQCWTGLTESTDCPYPSFRLVAQYTGRLDTMEECDKIALNMSIRYGCNVLPEAGTGDIIPNFRSWGYSDKLMQDPTYYYDRTLAVKGNAPIGIMVGDGEKKFEGLRLLRDFVYTVIGKTENNDKLYRLNTIYDLAFCLELQRFNLTGNFDRISSAIVAMFYIKYLMAKLKEEHEEKSDSKTPQKRLSQLMKKRRHG